MFDVAPTELLLVGIIALLVIGPKDLPKAMRVVGKWVGRARGVARQFRSGMDTMIRESELADMEKQWAAENERIMREHPTPSPALSGPQVYLSPEQIALQSQDGEPVMVEQPVLLPEPEPEPAPKPRKRKPPTTGDTLEAPKPVPSGPKARKPRAKAAS